jgi:hypothetical protein
VTRINPDPAGTAESNLLYSSYLGGADFENVFGTGDLVVIAAGEVYLSGDTRSPTTFPTTPNAYATALTGTHSDAFLVRLRMNGNAETGLLYGTYVGGRDVDAANGLVCDGDHVFTVVGETWQNAGVYGDFPTTPDALYPDHSGGGQYNYDGFLFQMESR